jgi:hypothetical protein
MAFVDRPNVDQSRQISIGNGKRSRLDTFLLCAIVSYFMRSSATPNTLLRKADNFVVTGKIQPGTMAWSTQSGSAVEMTAESCQFILPVGPTPPWRSLPCSWSVTVSHLTWRMTPVHRQYCSCCCSGATVCDRVRLQRSAIAGEPRWGWHSSGTQSKR